MKQETNRFNGFYQIHKALRAMLYQTANAAQIADFNAADEVEKVIAMILKAVESFDKHAHSEDAFIIPALQKHDSSAANLFEEEHKEDLRLTTNIRSLIDNFRQLSSPAAKIKAGQELVVAFTDFVTFNLTHMAKEESELNALLWKYYSDEELKEINRTLVANVEPEMMVTAVTWMMHGLNNLDIATWVLEVKESAPPQVSENILRIAAKELPPQRWENLKSRIGHAVPVMN
jgi:hemerythrin-like domain-containing protein